MGDFGKLTAGQRHQQRLAQAQPNQRAGKVRNLVSALLDEFPTPARQSVAEYGAREQEIMSSLRGDLDPDQRQAALQELTQTMLANPFMGFGVGNIKAYHGSPHAFTKFSTKHIGKGEGAQAYGHGLYFAENPKVAQDYARALQKTSVGGSVAPSRNNIATTSGERAAFYARRAYENGAFPPNNPASGWDAAIKAARQWSPGDNETIKLLKKWKAEGAPITQESRLYEVNIKPDPPDFLDWDKPLSQQSEKVRARLLSILDDKIEWWVPNNGSGRVNLSALPAAERAITERTARKVGGRFGTERSLIETGDPSIHDTYRALGQKFSGDSESSAALRKAGIRGIRYKDAGSRSQEGGTYNYVVFDDADVEIIGTK